MLELRGEAEGGKSRTPGLALVDLVAGGSIATVNLLGTEGRTS